MLEAAAVEHHRKALEERRRHGGVEVVNDRGALEVRAVDRRHLGGTEGTEQRLGKRVRAVRRDRGGEGRERRRQEVGCRQQELAADGHRPIEGHPVPLGEQQELESLVGDAHALSLLVVVSRSPQLPSREILPPKAGIGPCGVV